VTANQGTVAWNATTTLENGDPIPEGSTVEYGVWTRNEAGVENRVGTTSELQFTFTFVEEGKYVVGVSSKRMVNGEMVGESATNWSDVNGESTPNPFGFTYYSNPAPPVGLQIK